SGRLPSTTTETAVYTPRSSRPTGTPSRIPTSSGSGSDCGSHKVAMPIASTRKGERMRKPRRLWTSIWNGLAPIVLAVALVSCESADKAPATAAITAAQGAIDAVKGEAAKYVPDQLRTLESTLASAKASFEKQDYKAALASAQDVASKAKDLGAAAAAKKA